MEPCHTRTWITEVGERVTPSTSLIYSPGVAPVIPSDARLGRYTLKCASLDPSLVEPVCVSPTSGVCDRKSEVEAEDPISWETRPITLRSRSLQNCSQNPEIA